MGTSSIISPKITWRNLRMTLLGTSEGSAARVRPFAGRDRDLFTMSNSKGHIGTYQEQLKVKSALSSQMRGAAVAAISVPRSRLWRIGRDGKVDGRMGEGRKSPGSAGRLSQPGGARNWQATPPKDPKPSEIDGAPMLGRLSRSSPQFMSRIDCSWFGVFACMERMMHRSSA